MSQISYRIALYVKRPAAIDIILINLIQLLEYLIPTPAPPAPSPKKTYVMVLARVNLFFLVLAGAMVLARVMVLG